MKGIFEIGADEYAVGPEMTANHYSIGVDFGGTNLRIAAYSPSSGFLETIQIPARVPAGRDAVVGDMCSGIRKLVDLHSSKFELRGIAIGSPGPLELPEGRLRNPPNLPGFDGLELRSAVQEGLGLPVVVENDANLAALAECVVGKGKKLRGKFAADADAGHRSGQRDCFERKNLGRNERDGRRNWAQHHLRRRRAVSLRKSRVPGSGGVGYGGAAPSGGNDRGRKGRLGLPRWKKRTRTSLLAKFRNWRLRVIGTPGKFSTKWGARWESVWRPRLTLSTYPCMSWAAA